MTIPNGIETEGGRDNADPDRALRRSLGLDPARGLILNLGNLRSPKGQEFLLRAFARVVAELAEVDLAILGEGPLRGALEAQIAALGLGGRVHLLGHRENAAGLLAAGDLVVQSSIREGMPVSLLEAARACRAIVATDVGGTREFVVDGETGLLVAARDPEALASALRRVVADPRLRGRITVAGRERLLARHDIRKIAETTGALYDRLLEAR